MNAAPTPQPAESAVCTVCGGTRFGPGHGGRMSATGRPPACLTCGAVERHRIVGGIYLALAGWTKTLRALQFAPDKTLRSENFRELVLSTYNGENSMDMMATGLPAGRFDLIASNHVLEHVKDEAAAIAELLRVVGPKGVVHICVPAPTRVARTRDWGFPDPAVSYHFRIYGADAPGRWAAQKIGCHVLATVGRDPATDSHDVIYWLSRDEASLYKLTNLLLSAGFASTFLR